MIKSEFLELAYRYKGQDIVFMEVDVDKLRVMLMNEVTLSYE